MKESPFRNIPGVQEVKTVPTGGQAGDPQVASHDTPEPEPGSLARNRAAQAELIAAAQERARENVLLNFPTPSPETLLAFAIKTAEKPLPNRAKLIATLRENLTNNAKLEAVKLSHAHDQARVDFKKQEADLHARIEKGEAMPANLVSKEQFYENYQAKVRAVKQTQRKLREHTSQLVGEILDWLSAQLGELANRMEASDKVEFEKLGQPYEPQVLTLRCRAVAMKLHKRTLIGQEVSQVGFILDLLEAK